MCVYLYRFDVTEGQFLLIAELLFTATFGVKGWCYTVCKPQIISVTLMLEYVVAHVSQLL